MSKLWGGRFTKDTDKLTDAFNASISFDKRLYEEDIQGSIAHAMMLAEQKILTEDEKNQIIMGLDGILEDIKSGTVVFDESFEDIHMNIEHLLTERIGEAGKKLHTARSRNDQVATDMMLYVKKACNQIAEEIREVIKTLYEIALEHTQTIMPGYTHFQRAQPITYAHYLSAYIQMFKRDYRKFSYIATEEADELPLGSGALAGTTFNLNPKRSAQLLKMESIKLNSLDGVSDRDYAIDFLEACAVTMMHLSRFCEEIIIYNTAEFNFITLDDAYTTGSSMMPQKKNPDLAELIRGKTGRVYGNLISLLVTMKALPLAYNKDMQEDKEPVFDSFDTVLKSLTIFKEMVKSTVINKNKMLQAAEGGFTNATDLADWLVLKGVPFRDAHSIVGQLVLLCEKKGIGLKDLTLEDYHKVSPVFDETVYKAIDLNEMVNKREVPGGPAENSVLKVLEQIGEWLETAKP